MGNKFYQIGKMTWKRRSIPIIRGIESDVLNPISEVTNNIKQMSIEISTTERAIQMVNIFPMSYNNRQNASNAIKKLHEVRSFFLKIRE